MNDMIHCIRHLGISKGWRYWRLMRLCRREPAFALQWADALDREAMSHDANGITKYAPYLRLFAADIRQHYQRWKQKSPARVSETGDDPIENRNQD